MRGFIRVVIILLLASYGCGSSDDSGSADVDNAGPQAPPDSSIYRIVTAFSSLPELVNKPDSSEMVTPIALVWLDFKEIMDGEAPDVPSQGAPLTMQAHGFTPLETFHPDCMDLDATHVRYKSCVFTMPPRSLKLSGTLQWDSLAYDLLELKVETTNQEVTSSATLSSNIIITSQTLNGNVSQLTFQVRYTDLLKVDYTIDSVDFSDVTLNGAGCPLSGSFTFKGNIHSMGYDRDVSYGVTFGEPCGTFTMNP